ncbi:MAG: zinc-ribbon domain-containing protein [Butyrivibrio sp.]|uniref:zinc-ribbon domain-containing protein n=1 Tax=Butyrivibrio sp. TaxID=28121 RepID=UPI001B260011|nr:zinc-ribbon domain-containing protein [Butyrivibrio sp.]MBO6239473.1 zinc-ribbon domain-containing protein [Butyrivibrio sp.]
MENSLLSKRPDIAKEWNYKKNNGLSPDSIGYASKKKVWWIGKCGHEWDMVVGNRTLQGQGCPYCSGRRTLKGFNDFESQAGDLLSEWNYEKNKDIQPSEITYASNKKVWWIGKCGHEWDMAVESRTLQKQGCPFCSGNRVLKGFNDFESQAGALLGEWDYERNTDISPDAISCGSRRKVWWKCKNDHTWQAAINNRVNQKSGCPYCSGMYVWKGFNDLETVAAEYLKYWDYDKNEITPDSVSIGSHKKVWWKCEFGHSWRTTIKSVTISQTGCPTCALWQHSSVAEQVVFYYIKGLFPSAINGYRPDYLDRTTEIDVYIPEYKIGIEYDGKQWHTAKTKERDKGKTLLLKQNGVILYRIRELGCEPLNDSSVEIYTDNPRSNYSYMEKAVKQLIQMICNRVGVVQDDPEYVDISRDILKIRAQFSSIMLEQSLASVYPNIAEEWDYDKNEGLLPQNITPNSSISVWWKCKLGHSYKTTPDSRCSSGVGCPYCSYHKVLKGFNDLESQYPHLMQQWSVSKNTVPPSKVSCKSQKSYWWKCDRGHSYKMAVSSKTEGVGECPYCSGRLPIEGENDLATVFPDVVKEWDEEKNGNKRPYEYLPYSSQKIWWKCSKCGFSWNTAISNRTMQKSGCPKCLGRVVDESDNLEVTNPEVAIEWDYDRNAPLTPSEVKKGSHSKVWWKCQTCGFSWESSINNRVRGTGCPSCVIKNRRKTEYLEQYPELYNEWDVEKNGCSYVGIATKSNMKRWWKCSKCGYSWQAPPSTRANGRGCPACKGRVASENNNIGILFPELCKEWDFSKNGEDTPENTLPKSRKKIWWKCSKCGHSWQSPPYARTIGSGCPNCFKKKQTKKDQ